MAAAAITAQGSSANADSSYLNLPALLDPAFSPTAYANTLVLATNITSDTALDLSTPLSRVLFDAQEVDTHIDTLTTQHAAPLVHATQSKAAASAAVLAAVEAQVAALSESYTRLEREVVQRWEAADEVHQVASRLSRTLRLGRQVLRSLQLARQLTARVEEGRLIAAAETVRSLRIAFHPDVAGPDLARIRVVSSLRNDIVGPAERLLVQRAQGVVKEFSMSGLLAAGSLQQQSQSQSKSGASTPQQTQTYARTEETKSRATSAIHALYLLSPGAPVSSNKSATFEPTLLLSALTTYLQTSLSASTAAMARSLANLPTLDRTLLEVSARCQNLVALQALLSNLAPPAAALDADLDAALAEVAHPPTLLEPLLRHLDTASLPSFFWRSLAGALTPRVQEILNKGGSTARQLKAGRERVREAVRECVDRGSRLPTGSGDAVGARAGEVKTTGWEREAAVMVGSVVGPLMR